MQPLWAIYHFDTRYSDQTLPIACVRPLWLAWVIYLFDARSSNRTRPIACMRPLWIAWAINHLHTHYPIFHCLHSKIFLL